MARAIHKKSLKYINKLYTLILNGLPRIPEDPLDSKICHAASNL